MLYDLWVDPLELHPINEERPDLMKKYTAFLEAQWEAHRLLVHQLTPGEGHRSPLSSSGH